MIESMTTLNRRPSELMQELGPHACTDITGFGLLGHALEMARASHKGLMIHRGEIPILEEADRCAEMGLVPGGSHANRDFASCRVDIEGDISPVLLDILYDPQTSGGLLISLSQKKSEILIGRLHREGIEAARIVGEVVKAPEGRVMVKA
jgi:selenide,water dikinase